MPDEASPDAVQQERVADTPNAPALEQQTGSSDTTKIGAKEVNAKIKNLGDELHKAERWMIWLTGAIAFFGLCTVVVGLLQWNAMKGQLQEMHAGGIDTHNLAEASGDAANAASDQADAAQQFSDTAEDINSRMSDAVDQLQAAATSAKSSIDATQSAMRLDQRAWISLNGVGPPPELDKPWNLSIFFLNTGKTPAKKVQIACTVEPVASESSITWKSPNAKRPTLIPPNGRTMCVLHPLHEAKVTKEVLDALSGPSLHVYIYGSAVYQDIFAKWHWLTFCESASPDGQEWDDCEKGNDTGDGEILPPPFDKSQTAN